MKKLGDHYSFLDVSDYGRPLSNAIARLFKNTKVTAIHLTLVFGITGIFAAQSILEQKNVLALILLLTKSVIDGADGALARLKNKPSFTGRYLDSVFDFILNFIFLGAIWSLTDLNWIWWALAFFAIQLQGTLYNYYYVILRNRLAGGDNTSKVFEYKTPKALAGESQASVTLLFYCYLLCYGVFDRIIHVLDRNAYQGNLPKPWLMSLVSIYGLGFQLALIGGCLIVLPTGYILPAIVGYSIFIPLFILLRKWNW